MGSQSEETNVSNPQMVGNIFVEQYYRTLRASPEMAHKFYTDISTLSCPGPDGVMTSVVTMQGINEMILSLNYENNHHIDISSVDSQFSHQGGVIVLVTGFFVENSERRKFVQTFFLAPQGSGAASHSYFVLNDIFRFVDDVAPTIELTESLVDQPVEAEEDSTNTESPVVETVEIEEPIAENGDIALENAVPEPSVTQVQSDEQVNDTTAEAPVSPPLDTTPAPKKSFASVVSALKQNAAPFQVRALPAKPAEQPRVRAPVVPKPETPVPIPVPVTNDAPEKTAEPTAKAHAIFVGSLPMSATVDELEKLFKQYGPIKKDGIQVRSSKQQGTCFGFVEFESATAVQSALEASPIDFGSRKLSIEERRATNERPKFQGRSGYRNDNFRGGRGNFNGNRSFGRNDFERRGDFSGRARGNGNGPRNGEPNLKSNSNVEVKSPEADVKA